MVVPIFKNLSLFFICIISIYSQSKTSILTVGITGNSKDEFSPYLSLFSDKQMQVELIYGKGLYFYENERLKTASVRSVEINKTGKVILHFFNAIPFRASDIKATFLHYKSYYKKTKNEKYRFFGLIEKASIAERSIEIKLTKYEKFYEHFLALPILKKSVIELLEENQLFESDRFTTYRFEQTVIINSAGLILLNKQTTPIHIKIYPDEQTLFTEALNQSIDFFSFTEIPKFVDYAGKNLLYRFRQKSADISANHLTFIGLNDKKFKVDERNAFFQIINKKRLASSVQRSEMTASFFTENSALSYERNPVRFSPGSAFKFFQEKIKKSKERVFLYELFYPQNSDFYKRLANEIALSFAEVNLILKPVPKSREEILYRISEGKYHFYLLGLNYYDYEFMTLFNTLLPYNSSSKFTRFLNILNQTESTQSQIPIVQRLQLISEEEHLFFPLFFHKSKQYFISKKIRNYVEYRTINNQIFTTIKPIDEWVIDE